MAARVRTVAFQGIDVLRVDVQVQMAGGVPAFAIVGLPDKQVAESKERVRGALTAIGLGLPGKRIIVNLAPADLAKEGTHFDLPIALALLIALGALTEDDVARHVCLGELGLDGSIAPVAGVLPAAMHAANQGFGLICLKAQGGEAAWAGELDVLAPDHLIQLINHCKGRQILSPPKPQLAEEDATYPDLKDIKGQESAKRALEIAAAGAHNLFIVDLLDTAVGRLRAERERLNLALRAANAGTWEWIGQEVRWDRTFYEVTGIDPRTPPALDTYLAHIHPDDLPRMSRLRNVLAGEEPPAPLDEFRFRRPDGRTVWLQTYRTVVDEAARRVTGVTQDITARKENEMRIALLLREVTHRAKNQYAVIAAVIRETAKNAKPENLVEEVEARLRAMARSQDLLVHAQWQGAPITSVVKSQIEPFGIGERCQVLGDAILLSPAAVQYIGMALYELATNSLKYGALSAPYGKVTIAWSLSQEARGGETADDRGAFQLEWREQDGPGVQRATTAGFGRKVLEQLVSFALEGRTTLIFHPAGVRWTLFAPVGAVVAEKAT